MMVLTQQVLNEKLKEVNQVFEALTKRIVALEAAAKKSDTAKKPESK